MLIALASCLADVGLLILPRAVLSYLLAAMVVCYFIRHRRAAAIQRAIREVQRPGERTPACGTTQPEGIADI